MIDKVQKIKDWISKTQDGLMDAQGNFEYPEHEGAYHILCSLDYYIHSLQEEHVSEELEEAAKEYSFIDGADDIEKYARYDITKYNSFKAGAEWGMTLAHECPKEPVSEDLEKIVEEISEPTILNAYGTKELARRLRNTICGTSVSEDLEEAAEKYAYELFPSVGVANTETELAFKAGAKWQKEKDESTTEDLGEYINELSKQFPEVSFAKLSRIAIRVAKWKEQQLMANTIDAYCFGFQGDALFSFRLPADKYLVGSEVKVVVIKEE